MLFLGAGTSKAVGIGDLHDLTAIVKKRLKAEGYDDLIIHIIETLKNANKNSPFFNQHEIDIEVIFSVLNGLMDPTKALKELGPYAIYINELCRNPKSPYSDFLRINKKLIKLEDW
jgi:hypothetical protein